MLGNRFTVPHVTSVFRALSHSVVRKGYQEPGEGYSAYRHFGCTTLGSHQTILVTFYIVNFIQPPLTKLSLTYLVRETPSDITLISLCPEIPPGQTSSTIYWTAELGLRHYPPRRRILNS